MIQASFTREQRFSDLGAITADRAGTIHQGEVVDLGYRASNSITKNLPLD
tara:strand:+ start:348 stop:497 length:150 start_codon:yes stop_codon:yes gene_type:complete